MGEARVDQVAALKASLELMVAENEEIHGYFRDLLASMNELDALEPPQRREKFKRLVRQGAFRFNGIDVRHLTQAQPHKALPPPLFLNRTRRRLRNTVTLLDQFEQRGAFAQAPQLRGLLETLSSHIINEADGSEVMAFKEKVEALRDSPLFRQYMDAKRAFVHKDADFRTDADYLAARESVEEGEELFRQRAGELNAIGKKLETGAMPVEEAQSVLDGMAFDKTRAPPRVE